MSLLVLNFSHPITPEQQADIARLAGEPVVFVRNVPVQINHDAPLAPQIIAMADAAALSPEDWQTLPLAVNLPGLAVAAAALLAELHGRAGHFPTVVHLRPQPRGAAVAYVVESLVNLQTLRDEARTRR